MNTQTTKKHSKLKSLLTDNPLEARSDSSDSFVGNLSQTVKDDLLKASAKDFWAQVLGTGEYKGHASEKVSGDLSEGQEFHLPQKGQSHEDTPKLRPDILPGLNYRSEIVHGREKFSMQERREIHQAIAEIKAELDRLMESAGAVVQAEYAEITVEQTPTQVGKYHLNFFEWMLSVIRIARMKVEDSGAWMNALTSKKKGKGYWQMFKKHGTTFGLSNERVVSTQTG